LSTRKLTVQDIILMQKQLEAAHQLNHLLGEAVAEMEEAVSGIDPASVKDRDAAAALIKVKSAVKKLGKEVEEFNKGLK
jgi:hypothetical protein